MSVEICIVSTKGKKRKEGCHPKQEVVRSMAMNLGSGLEGWCGWSHALGREVRMCVVISNHWHIEMRR